jgi:hypothetical protein
MAVELQQMFPLEFEIGSRAAGRLLCQQVAGLINKAFGVVPRLQLEYVAFERSNRVTLNALWLCNQLEATFKGAPTA